MYSILKTNEETPFLQEDNKPSMPTPLMRVSRQPSFFLFICYGVFVGLNRKL